MPSASKQPKPPPNYFSRRVQFRLLMAVASLLLVITLMFEARKAENWQWMWKGVPAKGLESEEFDTRLPPLESTDPVGTVYANSSSDAAAIIQDAATSAHSDALHRLELDAWTKLLVSLERTERTLLDCVLLLSRDPDRQSTDFESFAAEVTARSRAASPTKPVALWPEVLGKISTGFSAYLVETNEAVMLSAESLAEQQRESLLNALRELEIGWTHELLPALEAARDSRPWTQTERQHLDHLQSLLDELAVGAIRDDSFWRPDERDAWFRWFEVLQTRNAEQMQGESLGQVGFLQLFKQSDEYRGKVVTIRGTTRLAYRVQAPPNIHGITGYVVYWVKPLGGPNSPIVVYALETPDGFPEIKDKDLDQTTTPLNEEVAVTGYYFKRWAYPGQGGLQTAPLLLARSPVWLSGSSGQGDRKLPSWSLAIASLAGVSLLSIALAIVVYRAGKKPVGEGTSIRRHDPDQLEALKKQKVLATPEETLRILSAADKEKEA